MKDRVLLPQWRRCERNDIVVSNTFFAAKHAAGTGGREFDVAEFLSRDVEGPSMSSESAMILPLLAALDSSGPEHV